MCPSPLAPGVGEALLHDAVGTGGPPSSQAEMATRLAALRVAGCARPADVRPQRVDRARGRLTNAADERRAASTGASHAALTVADELARDAIEPGVRFQRKTRPIGRIGTARAARPAHVVAVRRFGGAQEARPRNARNRRLPRRVGVCGPRSRGPQGYFVGDHASWMVPTAILPVLRSS